MNITAAKNAWLNFIRVPNNCTAAKEFKVPIVRTANGTHAGMVRFITSNGLTHIYPIEALSNNGVACSFAYRCG